MDELKKLLTGKPTLIRIIILICIGILVYFTSGCGLKADKVYFENLDSNLFNKGVCHEKFYY